MCGGRKNNPSTYHSSGLIQLCLFWLIIRFPLDGLPCFFHRPFIWEPDLGWRFGVLFQTARVGLTKPCMFVWIGWCVRKSWQDRLASQAISWYSYCMYSENDAWHGHWGPIFVVLHFVYLDKLYYITTIQQPEKFGHWGITSQPRIIIPVTLRCEVVIIHPNVCIL